MWFRTMRMRLSFRQTWCRTDDCTWCGCFFQGRESNSGQVKHSIQVICRPSKISSFRVSESRCGYSRTYQTAGFWATFFVSATPILFDYPFSIVHRTESPSDAVKETNARQRERRAVKEQDGIHENCSFGRRVSCTKS